MSTEVFFLILPVLSAGLTFIFYLKSPLGRFFNFPLDFSLKIKNKRLLGDNKTFRGLIFMPLFTAGFGLLFARLFNDSLSFHFSGGEIFFKFLLVGLSYSLGELPNSFIKRQLSLAPGNSDYRKLRFIFKPLDLFDSLIFVCLAYLALFPIKPTTALSALLLGGIIHYSTDLLMKKLKLKK